MALLDFVKTIRKQGKRSFTIGELAAFHGISRNYARVLSHRMIKSGDLISPAKGFYVIVPPEYQNYGSIPPEELVPLLMRHLDVDYYVALLSAGLFYGATHQKPSRFQVITQKRIKHPLTFGDVKIDIIYKKSLEKLPIRKFPVSTGYLNVAEPELIVLDLFDYPNSSGGLNHIATVLSELIEVLRGDELIHLAIQTKREYHLQRLGYVLNKIDPIEEEKALKLMRALATYIEANRKKYIPLVSEIPSAGCPRHKKWKIIENAEIESDL